jgi:hypothetical protein
MHGDDKKYKPKGTDDFEDKNAELRKTSKWVLKENVLIGRLG